MKSLSLPIVASLLLAAFSSPAPVIVSPFWDANGTDATAGNSSAGGGSGSWDATTSSDWWLSGNADSLWPANDVANFGGVAGTVTLNSSLGADGLTFTTPGYILSEGSGSPALTLGTSSIINVPSGLTTIGCILTGTTLTENGSGTLVFSAANTFTGSITINSGEIQINQDATAASTAAELGKTPASATANNIILNGGTLSGSAAFTLYKNRGIQLTANSTIDTAISGTTTMTVAGVISQSGGAYGITKTSAGILSLTGVNTFTGNITINNGTFQIGGSGSLNSGNYAGNIVGSYVTPINGSEPATFNYDSSAAQTLSGVISGTGLIAQNGAGTLTLTAANTYTGWTTINHGSVALSGSGSINDTPLIAIYNSGTLDVSALPSPYNFMSSTLVGVGTGTTAPAIKGAASGTVNLGSQLILLYEVAAYATPCLDITQGALTFNGNQIAVTNANPAAPLGVGTYVLIKVGNGSSGIINGSPSFSPIVIGGGNGWGSGLVSGDVAQFGFGSGSTASDVVMTVSAATVTTTTTTPSSITYGQPITATVTPASGSLHSGGVVQFFGNGGALGSPVPVNGAGVATLTSPLLAVGTCTDFSAFYSGSADNYDAASSSTTGAGITLAVVNPFSFASQTVVGTGLQVCWPTVSGVVYNVLTNGNLLNGGPASWVEDTSVGNAGAVTGDGNTDCVIIPSATLPSTNLFVLISVQ